VKVAAPLESTRLFDPADLHRLQASRRDHSLDFLAGTVVALRIDSERIARDDDEHVC
jgi:hypothetical protein